MGNHAAGHSECLGSAGQGQLVFLHPAIKVSRGEQTCLFTTELIQSVGSHIETVRPIEAVSPFIHHNTGEGVGIGKRGKGSMTVNGSGEITV
jgi:hypothetical protein